MTNSQAPQPVGVLARAIDLHEKAAMPWPEAERLALSEAGVDDAEIDEVVGEAGGLEMLLTTPDDLRGFARSVLVHGSARIAAIPAPEGTPLALPPPDTHCWDDDTGKDVWSYSADLVRSIVSAALAAPAPQAPAKLSRLDWDSMCEAFSRVIEAHAGKSGPFHNPVNADAMLALRELHFAVPAIKALAAAPQTKEPTNDR